MEKLGYLLIDAYNLAFKAVHVHDGMRTSSGKPSSVVYGVLQQIATARMAFQRYVPVVVWDGGYDDRARRSKEAVRLGIVPQGYKENRDGIDPFKQSVRDQVPSVKSIIACTDIPQVLKKGYEADDVIASYCKMLKGDGCIINYTCDDDYFQIIDDGVFRVSRSAGERQMMSMELFVEKYGIHPRQWVDVGALCGDTGDNIFGVPSCGEGNALKLIKEYGGYEAAIAGCAAKYVGLRAMYPDLSGDDLETLRKLKGDKRNPYLHCQPWMPFTGVALAIEQKRAKNPGKMVELLVAMYEKRVRLAYVLKKMVCNLALPHPKLFNRWSQAQFEAACAGFELHEIIDQSDLFACSEIDRD
jgi:5'-3' exonuclease